MRLTIQYWMVFENAHNIWICNSYAMDCPPVREDNPRALANMEN